MRPRCRSRYAYACRAPLLRERASRGRLPCPMRAGLIVSVSARVKACELDAVIVAGNRFEDARRDALRGFALVVAREHAVHVGVVDRPETFVDVHRERVGGGNRKDALSPVEQALPLKFAKASDEVRRDRRLRICFDVRADWWDSLAPTSEGLCRGV